MPHSIANVYLHSVFSTKHHQHLILSEVETEFHAYIGGIIKKLGGIPIEINTMPDHIHILSTLPRTITIADYLEKIKCNSSKWIKTKGLFFQKFAWQTGYATFSVSERAVPIVAAYIRNQKEHHRRKSFKREYRRLLDEHNVEYDERYLWD